MTDFADRLTRWESFYVIVGSSGAALIGLQFVVIALIADIRNRIATADSISAFGTPTVVHLGGALVVSALMSAPWPSPVSLSLVIGACGLGGIAYAAIVTRRARRQSSYKPVWEDWLWFAILPGVAYAALAVAAFLLTRAMGAAGFIIAAAALGLLLIGIHNAWDSVTFVVFDGVHRDATKTD